MSITTNALNNNSSTFDVDNINLEGNTISSTDTNGNVVIAPNGTGAVSITTAPIVPSGDRADSLGSSSNSWDNVYCDGLTFDDGTNILSSYVDITSFTPSLEFGGGTTGITYTSRVASYVRIGNILFYRFSLNISSKGTSTGNATITGFPVTTSANVNTILDVISNITLSGGRTNIYLSFSGTTASLQQMGSGTTITPVTDANFASPCLISGAGFYLV